MKLRAKLEISPEQVAKFLKPMFADSLHEKRLRSLQDSVLGTLKAAALGVTAIGRRQATENRLDRARGLSIRRCKGFERSLTFPLD